MAPKRYHILVVPSWYRNTYNLGAGSFVAEQAQGLASSGHKVGILCSTQVYWFYLKRYRRLFKFFRVFKINGLVHEILDEVFEIPPIGPSFLRRIIRKINRLRNRHSWVSLYKAYVSRFGEPDIVHFHSFYGAELAAHLRRLEKPCLVTEHWSGFLNGNRVKKERGRISALYQNVDYVVSVSNYLGSAVKRTTGRECSIIPNCVNPLFLRAHEQAKFDLFTFVSIGAHVPIKRYDLLIRAFDAAFAEDVNIQLRLVGEGVETESLKNLVSSVRSKDRIYFVGRLTREELAKEMSKCHCVVSSSEVETFGMTLVEGMALGLPALSVDCGGPSSIIQHEFLGKITGSSQAELSEGLKYIFENYEQYDSRKIKKFVGTMFTEGVVLNQLDSIYANLVGR